MTLIEIEERQKQLKDTINYEENLDCRNDKELIRKCWNEWHDLEKVKKNILNSSVDNI